MSKCRLTSYKRVIVIIALSLAMIVTLITYDKTISFAEAYSQSKIVNELQSSQAEPKIIEEDQEVQSDTIIADKDVKKDINNEPKRSNTRPRRVANVTWQYNAYGVVGSQYAFSDHWLEYYFTDDDNDPLDFYVKIGNGNLSQNGITYLTDENNNNVTTFIYTPTTAGTYDIKIYAYDGTDYSTQYVKITLLVTTANSTNNYYTNISVSSSVTDFTVLNSSGGDVSIGSGTTSNGITTYSCVLGKGTYTFSGVPSNGNQASGMYFTVPTSSSAVGSSSNPDVINIKQINVTVSGLDVNNVLGELSGSDYDLHLVNAAGNDVGLGISSSNLGNSQTIPLLIFANGNSELYNYCIEPKGTYASNNAAYFEGNVTYTGTTTVNKSITLPEAITYTFNVPTGATMQVFKQLRNYQIKKVSPVSETPITSGSIDTYTYRLPKNTTDNTYTYRVSDMSNNKVTKAGYLDLTGESDKTKCVSFDSTTPTEKSLNPDGTSKYDSSTTLGSRAEDSVLLNVKKDSNTHFSHNFRSLAAGQTFKLRAYRGAWQIINSDFANIMIEPDFHFTVVRGNDLITIDQDPDDNGNQSWCNVTANSNASGLAIVKVTYDAIDVDGLSYSGNTSQKFYATAEGREGYAIFNIGGTEIDGLMINAATSGTRDAGVDWDSEIDTFYYLGNSGTLKINPTAPDDTVTEVAYTHSASGSFTTVTKNGNYYDIPVSGNFNLIRIKAGTKVEYVPIRASKVTILVDDQELTSSTTVTVNQNHTIKLRGVYMPVPKFSGIYNPTMNKANYTVGNSTVSGNNLQYNFITQNKITWKPTSTGTYNFTNGYHSMRMFCNTTAKWGHHRLLTDTGIGANFSAGLVNGVFNIYPDFSIEVN